ncbi:hypothetical protein [Actinomadura sp. NPDC048394]|uniref:hypothetical protein n=1 Tax=Actinomadura sp. NPDC048394 TaxID=3158223 RepID=UPI0034073397
MVLAALIPITAVTILAGSLLLGPALAWVTIAWGVLGLLWATAPVRNYRRLERRIRAEAHIRKRQEQTPASDSRPD